MNKNTLHIVTDLDKSAWLKYICAEFKRINGFEGEIKIVDAGDPAIAQLENVIFYARESRSGKNVAIVNKSHCLPTGRIQHINDQIYVIEETATADTRFTLAYDLFWNAFVFLSRLEEYRYSLEGKSTLSHCLLHPRQDKSSLTVPIVNLLFNVLEVLIREHFPRFSFQATPSRRLELSHDVDYLSKTPQLMFKQGILNAYDVLRFAFRGPDMLKSIRKSAGCFDYWEGIEKKFDFRSIFYIHAKAIPKDLKTWIIDPTYDLSRHPDLQAKLRYLKAEGFGVGLHGSYLAAVDKNLLKKEKDLLEDVLEGPVTQVRQHWLRFNEHITPYIHNELFQYDSTLGWNDRIGFRNGCASLFHPYDHRNEKAFDYWETPQVIMDFNIYQSLGVENLYFLNRTFSLLDTLDVCKSVHVALSWHQQVCNSDYDWHKTYEMVLNRIASTRREGESELCVKSIG
jgi:hypothetical protein